MSRQSPVRRFTRCVAVVLLLAGPSGLRHVGQDDFACAPSEIPGGGAAQTIGALASDAAEHCVVCHWIRSLRSPSPSVARLQSAFVVGPPVDPPLALPLRAPALDRSPARAPPVAL